MLLRSSVTVGGYTLVSRVLGFVRDMMIAAMLGTGATADAFVVAFRIPNLFRRLVGEGAFTAAFVPLFARKLEQDGHDEAVRFANHALAFLAGTLLAFTLFAEASMPWLVPLFAPGFVEDSERFALTVEFSRITFPYLPCMAVVALLGGALNVFYRFSAMAAAPILLNILLIASLAIGYVVDAPGPALVWGVAAAGIAQVAMLLFACSRAGLRIEIAVPRLSPDIRRLLTLVGPGLIGGGVTQINIVIGTVIATFVGGGAVSFLYYADRVYQLPLGIVGIAVGTVLLPHLARQLRRGEEPAAIESLNRALEFTALLVLPAAVALAVVPFSIVSALFERGAFGPSDTDATAWALAAYALGLPAFVLVRLLSTGFFAKDDTGTPARAAVWSVAINVVLSVALASPLGHVGIALATSIAGWSNTVILALELHRRKFLRPDDRLKRRLGRIAAAAGAMGAALLVAAALWPAGGSMRVVALAALVSIGAAVYAAAVQLLGGVSLAELRAQLAKRSA